MQESYEPTGRNTTGPGWQFGLDEAGYGPNLGPLVQTAVGLRAEGDLWTRLATVVKKCGRGPRDDRLPVDDSKKVYGTSHSLKTLERAVLAISAPRSPMTVGTWLEQIASASLVELEIEPWFDPVEPLPIAASAEGVGSARSQFRIAAEAAQLEEFTLVCRVTPPHLFNSLLDRFDNKGAVLAHGVTWLLRELRPFTPVGIAIDRLGGRRYHRSLLETAYPAMGIEVVEETEATCIYRAPGPARREWRFEVEAESRHFTVALASMISKYTREILMAQFNRFWKQHLPEIKPTAGYPVDAARFIAEIRPTMQALGIEDPLIWRRR